MEDTKIDYDNNNSNNNHDNDNGYRRADVEMNRAEMR